MYWMPLIDAPHLDGLTSSPLAFPQPLSHSAQLDLQMIVTCLLAASCKGGWIQWMSGVRGINGHGQAGDSLCGSLHILFLVGN